MNYDLIQAVQGVAKLPKGKYDEVEIPLHFKPIHVFLTVNAHSHCGHCDTDIVVYEKRKRSVIISADIQGEEATIIYCIIGPR